MNYMKNRREFLRDLGVSTAVLPLIAGLPGLRAASVGSEAAGKPRQRVVFMFSPNGTVPNHFWPDEAGTDFKLKSIMEPLAPFKDRLLTISGLCNKVRGDGDGHMRGMSCLLTGIELFPGNIQGGSDTPAGWASGPSIDQVMKDHLQKQPETRTRFGSLELGVGVPNKADPWTRWAYAGPNQPVAPVSEPSLVFDRLYGQIQDRESVASVLDGLHKDLKRLSRVLDPADRDLLDQHATFVREMERDLKSGTDQDLAHASPEIEPGITADNDDMPRASLHQIELLVNAFANDMARIGSLQFTASVGQARMRWLGIDEGHHSLSHDPDLNEPSQEKLVKINRWFAEQLALLARRLSETPEPGGEGSMLDHTTILWTNELGKGNSHTLDNIPFVLVGGGLGFKSGRSLQLELTPHNRLWLSMAHAVGLELESFGNPRLSALGPLSLS